ncbi:MAG: hypothetical protein QM741_18595 [Rudaea sp.]|uniref:hypothetical protein n=1 Tax=Rudaea sp. TaxID=2136325 RepID=UPI0039E42A6B
MTALPLRAAAAALGLRHGTLRRHVRNGCPTVTAGHRGRGHAYLIDPDAVRQWLGADLRDKALHSLAAALPRVLAATIAESHTRAAGVDKRALAGILVGTWYLSATRLIDNLRELCPDIPKLEPENLPKDIDLLLKIEKNDRF